MAKHRQIDTDLLRLRELAVSDSPSAPDVREVLVEVDKRMVAGLPEKEIKKAYRATLEEAGIDEHAATDLDLYAETTWQLSGQFTAIIANLKKKVERSTYDTALAWKLWMHWYNRAAQMYVREFSIDGGTMLRFPPALRRVLAKRRARDEHEKIVNGEYGDLRVAEYRTRKHR